MLIIQNTSSSRRLVGWISSIGNENGATSNVSSICRVFNPLDLKCIILVFSKSRKEHELAIVYLNISLRLVNTIVGIKIVFKRNE